MATAVEKLPCPDCNSRQSLQVFLNRDEALGLDFYSSFCFSECWEAKGDPYNGGPAPEVYVKTKEDIANELKTAKSCPIFNLRSNYRGIPIEYFKSWGCRQFLSEFDGTTPYAIGFPLSLEGELVGWKARPLRKKDFFGIGKTSGVDPFGLERAWPLATDTLWITEGEFDAIALDYCMTLVGKSKMYPVISLSHGGGSINKNLSLIRDRLIKRKIKNLVLVLDDDEVGKLAEKAALRLWDNVYIVSKPGLAKDANDAVLFGYEVEMGKLALGFKND